jgi:transcriptional regulator with XRE-family HTH domain
MTVRHSASNIIGIRLKMEMARQGLTSVELARRADVKTSFIYDILNGKSANPSPVKLAKLAESLHCSIAYLIGSVEDPKPGPSTEDTGGVSDFAAIAWLRVEVRSGMNGQLVTGNDAPCLFRAAWLAQELRVRAQDVRLVAVTDDNMEPTLSIGDFLLVDTGKKLPSPPGLFVVFDGMALMTRRLELLPQSSAPALRVISDNARYGTSEQPLDDVRIIGRVIWTGRKL